MDSLQKKQLLTSLLDKAGWRARTQLGKACGVLPRQVSVWQSPKGGWPSAHEDTICDFFGIDPKTFSGDEKPVSIQPLRELSSDDTNQILEGVQQANEKLDVLMQAQGLVLPPTTQSYSGRLLKERENRNRKEGKAPHT